MGKVHPKVDEAIETLNMGDSPTRRRLLQGWTEASVVRDFEVLQDETERVVRTRIGTQSSTPDEVLSVIIRLIERAREISLRSWREAAKRAD